jgi:hypothetical protein
MHALKNPESSERTTYYSGSHVGANLARHPKEKCRHARRLFRCMVAAIRPLCVKELAEIFAFEFDPNEVPNLVEGWRPGNSEEGFKLLSACSTLIAITDDRGSKIVQFSHFSVKELLTSDRLQISEVDNTCDYYVPLEPAHVLLARPGACLVVLLQLEENVDKGGQDISSTLVCC